MKKTFIFILLLAGINVFTFSLTDTWLSLGFEFGNYFESTTYDGNKENPFIWSPGINLDAYQFWNKNNIGFFGHGLLTFPSVSTGDVKWLKDQFGFTSYDYAVKIGFIAGPGFRHAFNENFFLKYGAGISFDITNAAYTPAVSTPPDIGFSLTGLSFGIGGDVGIKYDINDVFYLSFGSILSFHFLNYTFMTSSYGNDSFWSNRYTMIGIRPYLAIGFNSYGASRSFGKPE